MKLAPKYLPRPQRRFWPAAPATMPTQDEQRERRRHWLSVTYDNRFDLPAEIESITGPLAQRVAADPVPASMRHNVDDLAEAVRRCVAVLADLVAGSADRSRVEHLATPEDRSRALRLIREHRAGRGRGRAELDDAALIAGTWPESLVELARGVSGELAAFLGRAHPSPRDGSPSASQRVETALREVDRAALSLSRRIERRAADRREFGNRPEPVDAVAAELAEMGVEL